MKVAALGAHTFGFVWSHEPQAAFAAIAAQGCTCVQLMATPPHFDPWRADAGRTKALRAALSREGLTLLALDLASSDVNLASPSVDARAFAVGAYRQAIARAAELGAPAVCIGSGRRHALFPGADARLQDGFRAAFAEIHAHARRAGVQLALENHPQGLLARADAIETFLAGEGYEDIEIIYDVANALAAGENPAEGLARLSRRIAIVHLSDTPRDGWRHDPIGSGDVDFDALRATLESFAYSGPIVLEIIDDDPARGIGDGVARLAARGWTFSLAKTNRWEGQS